MHYRLEVVISKIIEPEIDFDTKEKAYEYLEELSRSLSGNEYIDCERIREIILCDCGNNVFVYNGKGYCSKCDKEIIEDDTKK